jgi:hypothetical protein
MKNIECTGVWKNFCTGALVHKCTDFYFFLDSDSNSQLNGSTVIKDFKIRG